MEISLRKNSLYNKRPRSSCSSDLKSMSIITKKIIAKDDYKQKLLQQRQNDLILQRKYRENLMKKSEKRFWNSPFSINILAETEIQEHERSLISRTKKARSLSKNLKKNNGTQKYLSRLRDEIKQKNEGNFYIEEYQINSILTAKKSDDKLKKAKKNRERHMYETYIHTTQKYAKQTSPSNWNKNDFVSDINQIN